jgi:Cu(I)/Ag(I) efflux system membrane fusion protein
MRKKLNSFFVIAVLLSVSVISACKNEHKDTGHENHVQDEGDYFCPMFCEDDKTYPHPGNCPVCNMKLQLVQEKLVQTVSPNQQVLSRQATVKLQSGIDGQTIKAQGFIAPAQNHNLSIAARFGGRIEKLYIKFNNQYVKQGDKIMNIYSPDLRTYQEEHLFLLNSNADKNLIEKSTEKLGLLGITKKQIAQLEKNGTVALTISIYSPANGYVFFNTPLTQENLSSNTESPNSSMNMQQSAGNASSYAASDSQIREGIYVNEGQVLFSMNPLREVWAIISVSNQYLNQVQVNQAVEIISESNPSIVLNGKVALIEQTYEEAGQVFARLRIVLKNTNNSLKLNSLVTAQFTLRNNDNLQVPSSAVYKTGLNAYVWVKTDTTKSGTGIFQLRKVIAGSDNLGKTRIKSGLSPEDEIALQAGLMTDSETFFNEK